MSQSNHARHDRSAPSPSRRCVYAGIAPLLCTPVLGTTQDLLREHIGGNIYVPSAGQYGGDRLGRAYQLPDLNSDGLADYSIHGVVGRTGTGFYELRDALTGDLIAPRFAEDPSITNALGSMICPVGDFNGDGRLDLAVKAIPHRIRIVDALTGVIHVIIADFDATEYGASMAAVGDVNLDGFDDLLASSDVVDQCALHLGPHGTVAAAFGGGSALGALGDINGDGHPDFVISTDPDNDVTAYSGADYSVLYHVDPPAPIPNVQSGRFGQSMDSLRDMDGDGIRDFVVGRPFQNLAFDVTPQRGSIQFHSGRTGDLIRVVEGPFPRGPGYIDRGGFGYRLRSGGDVNGDGIDDVIVSSPMRGYDASYEERGAETLVSGATGEFLADLEATEFGVDTNLRGVWGEILGDLDGDGLAEWAVGSTFDETEGPRTGKIWIYRGAAIDGVSVCSPTPHSGGTAGTLALDGTLALNDQDMWLRALDLLPSTFAVFFASPGHPATPIGSAGLCVGAPGTFRLGAPAPTDSEGTAEIEIDFGSSPVSTSWLVGTEWTLQAVFRDPPRPLGLSSTNAIHLTWGV